MGIYAQVPGATKGEKVMWLKDNTHMGYNLAMLSKGYFIATYNKVCEDAKHHPVEDPVLLCIVDNGPFIAVAVILDNNEYTAFMDPIDPRPKALTWIKKHDLIPLLSNADKDMVDRHYKSLICA